ncbi:hypothetical protein J132_07336 [Termitomyces sp. J132]|nr:hypothetical protein J132_07336 [Termitomyces sp. J132]
MPTKVLKVDMAVLPLEIMLDMVVRSYANRMHRIKETNLIIERLSEDWRQEDHMTNPPHYHQEN